MKTSEFNFNGYKATVISPDKPNGKWLWKTEFLYAFDNAEQKLLDMGYTRVYYSISDKYGSFDAVRLMRNFHKYVVKEYNLCEKPVLIGYSRGGLYAFNYCLFYPEFVEKVYFDAPVLDLKSWPISGSVEQKEMFKEYCLDPSSFAFFANNPIDNLKEYFSYDIPTLLVAGESDELVPFYFNSGKMIDFAKTHGYSLEYYTKPTCGHHPHSLEDVSPIISFVERKIR